MMREVRDREVAFAKTMADRDQSAFCLLSCPLINSYSIGCGTRGMA